MTFALSDARIRVGANVTPSIGWSRTARRGSAAWTWASAVVASAPSWPIASRNARATSVITGAGCRAPSRSSSGAILSSALSPMPGIDAWPATPSVVSVKRKTPFSAQQIP